MVTFTFDDFPRSSLFTAGAILEAAGVSGTYFVSHGLAGTTGPTGEIYRPDDLPIVTARGHEFGCHTFHHYPAWATPPATYLSSIIENHRVHQERFPADSLGTHSYPISYPRPRTKRHVGRRFRAARGGGQTYNKGVTDLNYLNSFFLEQCRDDFQAVKQLIASCVQDQGWLIFSTHDVSPDPTRYGVTPEFFSRTVEAVVNSGASVVVMSKALDRLQVPRPV